MGEVLDRREARRQQRVHLRVQISVLRPQQRVQMLVVLVAALAAFLGTVVEPAAVRTPHPAVVPILLAAPTGAAKATPRLGLVRQELR